MPQPHERRQEERAPIELRVEYHRLNRFFSDYTRNISKGGTFIHTKKPLDVGTRFLFKLLVPHMDEPMVLLGEVCWVLHEGETREDDDAGEFSAPGMGIHFIYEDAEQQKQVVTTTLAENRVIGNVLKKMKAARPGGGRKSVDWWRIGDLNPWPLECHSSALPN